VVGRSGSIFESDEADNTVLLLNAMLSPSTEQTVRALLHSELFGYDIDRLTAWEASDAERGKTLEFLAEGRKRWSRDGIAVALNHLFSGCRAFSIASDPAEELSQERRITNYRHLIEILHVEEFRLGRNPERLLVSFEDMMNGGSENAAEKQEQRLESDYDAVQILTMHKAKGLQCPVVFAPELYRDVTGGNRGVSPVYSEAGTRKADIDPAKYDVIEAQVHQELREERMRVGYVTLTRAESLLIAVTADKSKSPAEEKKTPTKGKKAAIEEPKTTDWTPAARLLRSPKLSDLKDTVGPLVRIEPLIRPDARKSLISARAVSSGGRVRNWETGRELKVRWNVSSYSGLTYGLDGRAGFREPDTTKPEGIFAFPKGAEAGTALHSVFEKIDFIDAGRIGADPPQEITELIEGTLNGAGFSTTLAPEWVGCVAGMIRNVMQSPIEQVGPGFTLGSLSGEDRIAELEFNLNAAHPDSGKKPVTEETIVGILGPDIGRIVSGRRIAGYLNGFIDVVFRHGGKWWILDWKSNHLGNSVARYDAGSLEIAMDEHNYHLQYHLYTLALTRYLRQAMGGTFDYDRDFGGILYLFVRGVDGKGNGVYCAKPERRVIDRLEEAL
jgi:exodeoxyribonuclease V beta subunit